MVRVPACFFAVEPDVIASTILAFSPQERGDNIPERRLPTVVAESKQAGWGWQVRYLVLAAS
jgi:hypothetical protein